MKFSIETKENGQVFITAPTCFGEKTASLGDFVLVLMQLQGTSPSAPCKSPMSEDVTAILYRIGACYGGPGGVHYAGSNLPYVEKVIYALAGLFSPNNLDFKH